MKKYQYWFKSDRLNLSIGHCDRTNQEDGVWRFNPWVKQTCARLIHRRKYKTGATFGFAKIVCMKELDYKKARKKFSYDGLVFLLRTNDS